MPETRDDQGPAVSVQRADYTAPAFWIDTVDLTFDLDPAKTRVLNKMRLRRNPHVPVQPLRLDGDELNLSRVLVNGASASFKIDGGKLVLDNLPGAGKPLNLQRNLFAPEQDLAHQLLKDNDLAPAWIMERNDLLAAIKTLRTAVAAGWARHRREFDLLPAARDATSGRWYDMCRAWDAELAALNKRIVAYNLKRPGEQLELYQLDLDDELRRVGGTRWLRA